MMALLSIPEPLQHYADVPAKLDINAKTILELIAALQENYQKLYEGIFNPDNQQLKGYVHLKRGTQILSIDKDISLAPDDHIEIITSLSGG